MSLSGYTKTNKSVFIRFNINDQQLYFTLYGYTSKPEYAGIYDIYTSNSNESEFIIYHVPSNRILSGSASGLVLIDIPESAIDTSSFMYDQYLTTSTDYYIVHSDNSEFKTVHSGSISDTTDKSTLNLVSGLTFVPTEPVYSYESMEQPLENSITAYDKFNTGTVMLIKQNVYVSYDINGSVAYLSEVVTDNDTYMVHTSNISEAVKYNVLMYSIDSSYMFLNPVNTTSILVRNAANGYIHNSPVTTGITDRIPVYACRPDQDGHITAAGYYLRSGTKSGDKITTVHKENFTSIETKQSANIIRNIKFVPVTRHDVKPYNYSILKDIKCGNVANLESVPDSTIDKCEKICDDSDFCRFFSFDSTTKHCKTFTTCSVETDVGRQVYELNPDIYISKIAGLNRNLYTKLDETSSVLLTTTKQLDAKIADTEKLTEEISRMTELIQDNGQVSQQLEELKVVAAKMTDDLKLSKQLNERNDALLLEKQRIIDDKDLSISEKNKMLQDTIVLIEENNNNIDKVNETLESSQAIVDEKNSKLEELKTQLQTIEDDVGFIPSILEYFNSIFDMFGF
jgi:hypothetical protein